MISRTNNINNNNNKESLNNETAQLEISKFKQVAATTIATQLKATTTTTQKTFRSSLVFLESHPRIKQK